MAMRGALSPTANLAYGLLAAIFLYLLLFCVRATGVLSASELLAHCFAFPLGVVVGLPAYVMNRRALQELHADLENKIFLSSQLALLSSRHGKNAVAYFYFVLTAAIVGPSWVPRIPMTAWGYFAVGMYLCSNVFPFVFRAKRA